MNADEWREYLKGHRDQFASDFEQAAALIRAGDMDGLVALASRSVAARASAAALAARRQGEESRP